MKLKEIIALFFKELHFLYNPPAVIKGYNLLANDTTTKFIHFIYKEPFGTVYIPIHDHEFGDNDNMFEGLGSDAMGVYDEDLIKRASKKMNKLLDVTKNKYFKIHEVIKSIYTDDMVDIYQVILYVCGNKIKFIPIIDNSITIDIVDIGKVTLKIDDNLNNNLIEFISKYLIEKINNR